MTGLKTLSPWGHNPRVSIAHKDPHYKERQHTLGRLSPETLTPRCSALTQITAAGTRYRH